jgi:hypothetical protein
LKRTTPSAGHRDSEALLEITDHLENAFFETGCGVGGIGDQLIDVELQGVGSGLFDQLRVVQPPAAASAVEGCDNRELDSLPDAVHLFDVFLGSEGELFRCREIAESLGERVGRGFEKGCGSYLFAVDLLLEKRSEDNSGGTGVLEEPHGAEIVG